MKKLLTGLGALMMSTAPALAGGLERAPQSIAILFEDGNYLEAGIGRVDPTVSGNDVATFGGRKTGDVALGYNFGSIAYKHQFNPNLSAAFIIEQPYGSDVRYPGLSATEGSVPLSGTAAFVDSTTYTALLRYKMDNGFGIHGGLRGSRADAKVTLDGRVFAAALPATPYYARLESDLSWGYAIGASYEKPEIAARVSLTYNSPITHSFDTEEYIAGRKVGTSNTDVDTPRSWNLEAQTGVAPGWLVFGSVRWVKWSEFKVKPRVLGRDLVSLDDTTTYVLGVGHKFNENWSGAASFTFEPKAGDDNVSPLSPTNGRKGVSLAAIYTQDNWKITGGISYFKLGDADAAVTTPAGERAFARMSDGDALGVGLKVGYRF